MGKTEVKIEKRRLRSSYITSTLSISLVLFLLGLICLLLINTKVLTDNAKENIGFLIILNEGVKEVDIIRLKKSLDAKEFVKSTEYITKEQADREMMEYLNEDFIDFVGYSPLTASIDIKLYAPYANNDSINKIQQMFSGNEMIKDISYEKDLVDLVNDNVGKISFFIFIISLILFLIAFALINNTIRLLAYSKRFIINTMQLVGATHGYIRRPFMLNGLLHGIYGAFFAILYLIGFIYYIQNVFHGYIQINNYKILGIVFAIVLALGLIITSLATFFAINKYLRMKTDDLYY